MKVKIILPKECSFCSSNKVKQSSAYPTDWFCQDCKKGGLLPTEQKESNLQNLLNISRKHYFKTIQINQSKDDFTGKDPFSVVKKDKDGNIIDIISWDI